jgi:hypothetical protein
MPVKRFANQYRTSTDFTNGPNGLSPAPQQALLPPSLLHARSLNNPKPCDWSKSQSRDSAFALRAFGPEIPESIWWDDRLPTSVAA